MATLKEDLSSGIVKLTFEKKNGELREMRCTTNQNLFEYNFKGDTRKRNPESTVVSVWDVDKNEFRSFDSERVIDWSME